MDALGFGNVLFLTCHSCREGHQALQGSQPFAWKHCDGLRVIFPDQRDHQGSLEWEFLLVWIITSAIWKQQIINSNERELFLYYLIQNIFRFGMTLNLYTILGGSSENLFSIKTLILIQQSQTQS